MNRRASYSRSVRRPRVFPLLLLSLPACAASPAPTHTASHSSAPPTSERPATWVTTIIPPVMGPPFRAGDEQDGSVAVFGGGLRIHVRAERTEWSHDATLAPIVGHARDGEQWLFATADGALFRSATFAGPLERVGEPPADWFHCGRSNADECAGFDSTGTVAVRSSTHRLFLGTDEGLVPARAPFDRTLVDVGFVDRRFGVAIVAPGQVWRTVDGAAHGERIDLGSDVAYVVYPHGQSFVLATTRGLVRIDRDGPPAPFTGDPDVFDHQLPEEASRAIVDSLAHDDPFVWPMLLARGAVLLADGRIASVEGEQLRVRNRDGEGETIDLPGDSCALHPYGGQLIAACENNRHERTIQILRRDRWDELRALPEMGPLVVAPDGGVIVAIGPCSEDDPHTRDSTAVCWFNGSAWHTAALPAEARILAAHGDALLYADAGDLRFHLLREGAVDAGEAIGVPGARVVRVTFAADGSLVVLARGASGLQLHRGDSPARLTSRPLPANATRVGFVDATRGIAFGPHLTDGFTTVDGGAHWTALDLPVEGDASRVSVDRAVDFDFESMIVPTCTPSYCSFDGEFLWSSPALAPREPVRILAATHAAPSLTAERQAVDPTQIGYANARYSCDRVVPPADREPEPPRGRLFGADGWIDPHVTGANDAGAGRYAFAWGGIDDRGAFTAHARAVTLPPIDANAAASTGIAVANSDVALLLPRYHSRALALLERCAGPYFAGQCDLVAIPANGTPAVLGTTRSLLGASDTVSHVRSVIALADGGAAVMISTAFPTFASEDRMPARLDAVLRVSPRGAIVQRRSYAWGRARTVRMIARDAQGLPGLAVTTSPAMRTFVWYGLDPSRDGTEIATLPGALRPCRADASDAVTIVAGEADYGPSLDVAHGRFMIIPPYNGRALLESAGGAMCLRGESFWSLNPADDQLLVSYLGGTPRWRARAGQLEADVASGTTHAVRMRCEVP